MVLRVDHVVYKLVSDQNKTSLTGRKKTCKKLLTQKFGEQHKGKTFAKIFLLLHHHHQLEQWGGENDALDKNSTSMLKPQSDVGMINSV